jgi:hypothetical protein
LWLQVVIREYKDQSKITLTDQRGGPLASSHVEVLGNTQFLEDLLYAAAGWHHKIDEDRITSPIMEISHRIEEVGMKMRKG